MSDLHVSSLSYPIARSRSFGSHVCATHDQDDAIYYRLPALVFLMCKIYRNLPPCLRFRGPRRDLSLLLRHSHSQEIRICETLNFLSDRQKPPPPLAYKSVSLVDGGILPWALTVRQEVQSTAVQLEAFPQQKIRNATSTRGLATTKNPCRPRMYTMAAT